MFLNDSGLEKNLCKKMPTPTHKNNVFENEETHSEINHELMSKSHSAQ